MPNTPFEPTQNFDAIAIDQTGKFAYAFGGGQIFAYSIQKGSGQLVAVAGSPFMAAPATKSFDPGDRIAVDQSNKFLYVGTTTGILGYTIDPNTGALFMIAGSPFGATVPNIYSVVVVPSDYLYATAYANSGGIYGYTIDKNTGALTPLSGSPFDSSCGGADNLTAPASGKFMFAAHCGMFSVDAATGALTHVANDPSNLAADYPVFDPTGKFLWLVTMDQNCWHCDVGVTAYDIDPNSGALTQVPNSFFVMQNTFSGGIEALAITQ